MLVVTLQTTLKERRLRGKRIEVCETKKLSRRKRFPDRDLLHVLVLQLLVKYLSVPLATLNLLEKSGTSQSSASTSPKL
jgi:hypothetical protein